MGYQGNITPLINLNERLNNKSTSQALKTFSKRIRIAYLNTRPVFRS